MGIKVEEGPNCFWRLPLCTFNSRVRIASHLLFYSSSIANSRIVPKSIYSPAKSTYLPRHNFCSNDLGAKLFYIVHKEFASANFVIACVVYVYAFNAVLLGICGHSNFESNNLGEAGSAKQSNSICMLCRTELINQVSKIRRPEVVFLFLFLHRIHWGAMVAISLIYCPRRL